MAEDTKERVLTAAPEMFAQKGYEGAGIREPAASLGPVRSGIHKRCESKEAIRNARENEERNIPTRRWKRCFQTRTF